MNFIDKTFTIIADVLLKTFPASKQENAGEYQTLEIIMKPYKLKTIHTILYNIGLVYSSNGDIYELKIL